MKKREPSKGFLIDIEGVLVRDKRYQPIAGAVPWVRALREAGTPFCLVSNNTTHRPAELIADLVAAGFPVAEDDLVGALDLGRRWLQERGHRRLLWLGTPALLGYWQDLGFETVTDESCEVVVLGANTDLAVADLDRALAAVLEREDVRDVLIGAATIAALPEGARVGTSAPRRAAQLLHARPDCRIVPFRGNVATRLAKLAAGEADATLLAAAGLNRLGESGTGHRLPAEEWLPAPGQGAILIECRSEDAATRALLAAIDDAPSRAAVMAERALLESEARYRSLTMLSQHAFWETDAMHRLGHPRRSKDTPSKIPHRSRKRAHFLGDGEGSLPNTFNALRPKSAARRDREATDRRGDGTQSARCRPLGPGNRYSRCRLWRRRRVRRACSAPRFRPRRAGPARAMSPMA
mgnify:CR=1 FL=1